MWLINTETLRLEYFANPIKQSYAILSHTWGDEEVSFHQMADLKAARKMAGFAKIKTTCQLAKSRSLQYAWVDTCCIDKSSSAELSEAINSMFRWYEESTVCFAFLCDLTHSLEEPVLGSLYSRLEKCRWFRRGWTLQELLAPRSVLFYDASWRLVGDKAQGTFCHILSTITNIDYSVLKDCRHINSMPAGVRMSWAADRKTTRPEDTAYCMLGIFNISMPLLYGEGETAFIRLQEEICKQNNDMSLFAWTQQANSKLWAQYRGIFAFHPSEFLGLPEIDVPRAALTREFTITNKGIRFDEVELLRSNESRLIMPLNITVRGRNYGLGIDVLKTLNGYVRSQPTSLAQISAGANEDIYAPHVYLVKHTVSRGSPHHSGTFLRAPTLCTTQFKFQGPWNVEFVDVIPSDAFDYAQNEFIFDSQGFWGFLHLRVKGSNFMIVSYVDQSSPIQARYDVSVRRDKGRGNIDWPCLENNQGKLRITREFRRTLSESMQSNHLFSSSNEVTLPLGDSLVVTLQSLEDFEDYGLSAARFCLWVKFQQKEIGTDMDTGISSLTKS